jgi:hypothetical protein
VAQALRDRDAAIVSAGYQVQVTEVEGLSLVFERTAGRLTNARSAHRGGGCRGIGR